MIRKKSHYVFLQALMNILLYADPLTRGFITGGSLIMAIGAQNMFLLTQSIQRQHHLLIASLCILLDGFLIFAGMYSMTSLIQSAPEWLEFIRWVGVLFLLAYGTIAFRSAFKRQNLQGNPTKIISRRKVLLITLSLTLLNPHAYLDTFVLLSSVGAQFNPDGHFYFSVGACIAAFIWFYSVSFGGGLLQPLFKKARTWQVLDVLTGLMMWGIALGLAL